MLLADDQLRSDIADQYLIAGELALDGRVRAIKGALSMSILAGDNGFRGLIVPRENAEEAAIVQDVEVYAVSSLTEAVGFLAGQLPLEPMVVDLEKLFGAAGRHSVLTLCPSTSARANVSR